MSDGSQKNGDDFDHRRAAISAAAWVMEDTLKGRKCDKYPTGELGHEARALHLKVSSAGIDHNRAIYGLMILSIFECPAWCNKGGSYWDIRNSSGTEACFGKGEPPDGVLLSNIWYLPPGIGLVIELFLVLLIARKLLLERKLQRLFFDPNHMYEYINKKWLDVGILFVIMEVMDIFCYFLLAKTARFAFLARTGFLFLIPAIQRLSGGILAVFKELTTLLAFYIGTIVFFAWVANMTFSRYTEVEDGHVVPKYEDFAAFNETLYTMWVSASTDDFMERFKEPYLDSKVSGLLWLVFLVIVKVLLLNLVLDTLVHEYTKSSEELEEKTIENSVDGITRVFEALRLAREHGDNDTDGVPKEDFCEFIAQFSKSPDTPNIPPSTAELMFDACNEDPNTGLMIDEFNQICAVIGYKFWTTRRDSHVKDMMPWLWNSTAFSWIRHKVVDNDDSRQKALQDLRDKKRQEREESLALGEDQPLSLRSKASSQHDGLKESDHDGPSSFDAFMDKILMLNFACVVCESLFEGKQAQEWLSVIELMFSFTYLMECGVKLCVISFEEYWSSVSNQFDFHTTWLLLAASAVSKLFTQFAKMSTFFTILRLMRLLRVLKSFKNQKETQFMIKAIVRLAMEAGDVLLLLWLVLYFYTTLSVQVWGGLFTEDKLQSTEYWGSDGESGYKVLNFNDFPSAFGVWIVVLLRRYEPIFQDAIFLATSPTSPSLIIMPSFWFCAVVITFEIVKAFTIEVFIDLFKERHKKETEEFGHIDKIREQFEEQGLKLHYKVVGDVSMHNKIQQKFIEEMEGSSDEDD